MDARAAQASAGALDWLVAHQTVTGEVPCWSTPLGSGEPTWSRDTLCFVTALAVLALDEVDDHRASTIVDRGVAFLRTERERSAQWRYWADGHRLHDLTPPDADDTACCSMAVARRGDDTEANVDLLLALRDPDGRFRTWLTPTRHVGDPRAWWAMRDELTSRSRRARRALWAGTEADANDVDAVVNANVCRYLAPDRAPPEAVRWVVQTIRDGREATADKWHRNRFTAYASVADGARRGIIPFSILAEPIAARIGAHLLPDGTVGSGLDTAHALLALQAFGQAPELQRRLAEGLIASQQEDGHWERSVFYHGGPSESVGWASEALTTACAAAALAHGAGALPATRRGTPSPATPPDEESPPQHILSVIARAEPDEATTTALELMDWLHRERPTWTTSTLVLERGGALDGQLESMGPLVWADRPLGPPGRSVGLPPGLRRLRLRADLRRLGPADAAHLHGLDAEKGLRGLRPPAPSVVRHLYGSPVELDAVRPPGPHDAHDRDVTVSSATAAWLADRSSAGAQVISHAGLPDAGADHLDPAAARARLGVDGDAFLVVAFGADPWDDGAGLCARVARAAGQGAPGQRWHFLWIGMAPPRPDRTGRSVSTPVQYRPEPVGRWGELASADVLLVPGREDASRAALAAAGRGVPTVAFDTGRAADLLRDSAGGTVVPYPDVAGMAAALVALAEDPERRRALGTAARDHARSHLTIDQLAPRLLAAPDRLAPSSP